MNKIQLPMRVNQTATPGKIVCIGRNYVAHIEELGNEMPDQMVVFNKPNSAISETLQAEQDEVLHYEAELCFFYEDGRFTAVAIGLDLTKRGLQNTLKEKGLPWERAKAFDGAALFSHFMDIDTITDELTLELEVDGEIRQRGKIAMMMFKPMAILAELNTFMRLDDGDIVMSGTPAGVGPIKRGEKFTGRVISESQVLVEHTWNAI